MARCTVKIQRTITLPMTNQFFSALFAKDSAFEDVRIVLSALSAPLFSLFLQKDAQYDTYNYFRDYYKELQTVCANVDNILGTEREVQREQQQFRKSAPSL